MKSPILLDEYDEEVAHDDNRILRRTPEKRTTCLTITTAIAILAIVGLIGGYVFISKSPAEASDISASSTGATEPFLGSANVLGQDCDVCETLDGIPDYTVCRSCEFNVEDEKSLVCPVGFGDIKIVKVKTAAKEFVGGSVVGDLYKYCKDNEDTDGSCTFTWNEDIVYDIVESEDEEGNEILLARRPKHGGPDIGDADMLKVDYTCGQKEVLLSSALSKCDTCMTFNGVDDYQTCKTCNFKVDADKDLVCPSYMPNIQILRVKRGEKTEATKDAMKAEEMEAVAGFYAFCKENWNSDESKCTINWNGIMGYDDVEEEAVDSGATSNYEESTYSDLTVYGEEPTFEGETELPLIDEEGEVINPRKKHKHKNHRCEDDVKVEYLCHA